MDHECKSCGPHAGAVVVCALVTGQASAALSATASDASGRSASAQFARSGSNLVITLTNTATADVTQPIFVLTGIFFDITGPTVNLTRTSVVLNSGSVVINAASQPAGGVVGGEFAYRGGLVGAPRGASQGVSSAGLGLFGPGDLFPGPDLDPPLSPNGLNYGITSAGDNPATNNGGTDVPLIKNSVVITLSGVPTDFVPENRITNISFQYGTGLDEPNLLIPAPSAATLVGAGLLVAGRRRRR